MAVKYKGKSIADLLDTTVEEALPLLENIPQIKQKLHIPAPQVPAPNMAPPAADAVPPSEPMYTVKSGDTLTKIATDHGTTVKAIRGRDAPACKRMPGL